MRPLLSIVVPSNNRTELLEEAINSIISDPGWGSDCELCISDNSKSDETGMLIQATYASVSGIIYRRSLDAPSLDENVNMAVSMANGEYAWIFGDDDLISPGFLRYFIEYLRTHAPDIVVLNSRSFQDGEIVEDSRLAFDSPKIYGVDDNDAFLADYGGYLTYVGGIAIRKALWQQYLRPQMFGTFFAHIDAVCRAKLGHVAHYLSRPAIDMRLHFQTWTSKHFEIWNIFFPKVIWGLDDYSTRAKNSVIQQYPLKSTMKILSSRAYGKFNFKNFRETLLRSKNSTWQVKVSGFFIAILPREIFRRLYILYILLFKRKHDISFSPKLALAQLQKK